MFFDLGFLDFGYFYLGLLLFGEMIYACNWVVVVVVSNEMKCVMCDFVRIDRSDYE